MYTYPYSKKTKEAIKNPDGSYKKIALQVDQLNGGYLPHPKGTLPVEPPEVSEYQVAIANEDMGVWDIVPDYKGTWYNKETKDKIIITEFNQSINVTQHTKKEPTSYSKWDEEKNDWIFDLEEYKTKVINDVNAYSFSHRQTLFPDYKFQNLLAGVQSSKPYTLDTYKKLIEKCKSIVHGFEDNVNTCSTKDKINILYEDTIKSFPKSI